MTTRAIILVPGFAKREQQGARDELVRAIDYYSDGYVTKVSEESEVQGADVIRVNAEARQGSHKVALDVYEAYWGDLVPDFSSESPWQRFKRGLTLITYWVLGGLAKSVARREWPTRTMLALVSAGALLVLWYLVVIAVLVNAYVGGEVIMPEVLTNLLDQFGASETVKKFADDFVNLPVIVFLLGLFGLGWLEGIANVSAFTKAYLRDDAFGDTVGLRAKAKQRVLAVLDHVHEMGDTYDEVYVVAHSMGGAIAVDALAEYGDELSKTSLFTWGTALGAMVQQEPMIEGEIEKFYTAPVRIKTWIDVVFARDMMGSKVPVPMKRWGLKPQKHVQIFPDTVEPPLPKGLKGEVKAVHDRYYQCHAALIMLVEPAASLPQPPDAAPVVPERQVQGA